jgi:kynurenine 3-monooxygenase
VEPSVLIYQTDLCGALLEELDRRNNDTPSFTAVDIRFDANVTHVNLTSSQITIDDRIHDTVYDLVIGCDGANSIVRNALQTYSPPFRATQRKLPGYFKVARVPVMPPKMDPRSVGLVLPRSMKAGVTAFVEPTVGGGGCILFAGRLAGSSSSNDDEKEIDLGTALFGNDPCVDVARVEAMILDQFPLLEGTPGLNAAVQTLLSQRNGIADSVKCNIYHSRSDITPTVICGDAAHATGGVSGQGCNSALIDAMILSDCLEKYFPENVSDNVIKREMLHQCLKSYSEKQVPEGWALYDLSFGNDGKTLPIFRNLASMLSNAVDSLFQGRWGIGKKPLQTLLASSSTSFSSIRRDREKYFVDDFPSDESFREMLHEVYN